VWIGVLRQRQLALTFSGKSIPGDVCLLWYNAGQLVDVTSQVRRMAEDEALLQGLVFSIREECSVHPALGCRKAGPSPKNRGLESERRASIGDERPGKWKRWFLGNVQGGHFRVERRAFRWLVLGWSEPQNQCSPKGP